MSQLEANYFANAFNENSIGNISNSENGKSPKSLPFECCESDISPFFKQTGAFDDYEVIEFLEDHKTKMLTLLNLLMPDFEHLDLISDVKQLYPRLACLVQFFNDSFEIAKLWPNLGNAPLLIRTKNAVKKQQLIKDQTMINDLNLYFIDWLSLFYNCNDIIKSLGIKSESLEMTTILILNVFSTARDCFPQLCPLFDKHWEKLQSFTILFESIFVYDNLFIILQNQLKRERIIYQQSEEKHFQLRKELKAKQIQIDQLTSNLEEITLNNGYNSKNEILLNSRCPQQHNEQPLPSTSSLSELKEAKVCKNDNKLGYLKVKPRKSQSLLMKSTISPFDNKDANIKVIYPNVTNKLNSSSNSEPLLPEEPPQNITTELNSESSDKEENQEQSFVSSDSPVSSDENLPPRKRGRPKKLSPEPENPPSGRNRNKLKKSTSIDTSLLFLDDIKNKKPKLQEKSSTDEVLIAKNKAPFVKRHNKKPSSILSDIERQKKFQDEKALIAQTDEQVQNNNDDLPRTLTDIKSDDSENSSVNNIDSNGNNMPDVKSKNLNKSNMGLSFGEQLKNADNESLKSLMSKNNKNFQCRVCWEEFPNPSEFRDHLFHHYGKLFSCEYCKKIFINGYRLKRHLPCHTGVRPFSCSICMKTFTRKDKLNEHIKLVHKTNNKDNLPATSIEHNEKSNGNAKKRPVKNKINKRKESTKSTELSLPILSSKITKKQSKKSLNKNEVNGHSNLAKNDDN